MYFYPFNALFPHKLKDTALKVHMQLMS